MTQQIITKHADPIIRPENAYKEAFRRWMLDWQPDVFVTINLPSRKRTPRDEAFYLNLWTWA